MYHAVVARKLRAAFARIDAGTYADMADEFAPRHTHTMHGTHALAGMRTNSDDTTAWYARLHRLLPDLRFTIEHVLVQGWPWRTTAVVTWADAFTLPDGGRGSNRGVHVFTLAWGKVTSLEVHCDTARLEGYLARMLELGAAEAGAPPIVSGP